MTECTLARELEADLRLIIQEVGSRKTLPHIRDRAERSVASTLMVVDKESWNRATEEVLSTLLITTESGSIPKLIIVSLSILQKLASSSSISCETFLHMVTVLCKAASSLTGVLSLNANSSPQPEIEAAQIRCLQTLHLLQTKEMGRYFLNDIALSQMLGMCVKLSSHPTSTAMVAQTAQAAIPHLHRFVMEVTKEVDAEISIKPCPKPLSLNSLGELQGLLELESQMGLNRNLFLFLHDLVTMSCPSYTSHVPCQLFGSGRIKPALAIEMLTSMLSSTFWVRYPECQTVVNRYLLPLISKLVDHANQELSLFKQMMKLFVKISREKEFDFSNKIYLQIHNYLVQDETDQMLQVLFTEVAVLCIASNPLVVFGDPNPACDDALAPLGGDSPTLGRNRGNIAESMVESVCMRIHALCSAERPENDDLFTDLTALGIKSINEGTGMNSFSLLYSRNSESFLAKNSVKIAIYLDFLVSFIDTCFKQVAVTKTLPDCLSLSWTSDLSCLVLVISHTGSSVPGVLSALEKLVYMMALTTHKEGLHACIGSLLKLSKVNKFVISVFHRLASDEHVLESISTDSWKQIVKKFQIMSLNSIGLSREDLTVQDIAMDTLFQSPSSNLVSVERLTHALIDADLSSVWTLARLGQLLTCNDSWSEFVQSIWTCLVSPNLILLRNSTDRRLSEETVYHIFQLVKKLITKFPHLDFIDTARQFSDLSRGVAVGTAVEIAESSGHLLTEKTWSSLVRLVMGSVDGKNENVLNQTLRFVEISIEEFPEKISKEINRLVFLLTECTINHDVLPATAAFKAIALVLKISESVDHEAEPIEKFFHSACTDKRAPVRNCALKTLGAVSTLPVVSIQIAKRVIEHGIVASPEIDESNGLVVHHSRDSEEKRWSESVVLSLQAVGKTFIRSPDADTRELEPIFFHAITEAKSDEVVQAGCKLFVEIWKLNSFRHNSIFELILSKEIEKRESKSSLVLASILFSTFKKSCEEVESIIFEFLQCAVIRTDSLFVETAVPFASHPTLRYRKEIEPYRPVVEWSNHRYEVVPASTDLSSFLSHLFSHISIFNTEKFCNLFLDPQEFVYRDSYTLAISLRVIESLRPVADKDQFVVESLKKIVRSRNFAIPIASCGLWKYALQILIESGASTHDLLESIPRQNIDVIDYVHACVCLRAPDEMLEKFLIRHLGTDNEIGFRIFVLQAALVQFTQSTEKLEQIREFEAGETFMNRTDDEMEMLLKSIGMRSLEISNQLESAISGCVWDTLRRHRESESTVCSLLHLIPKVDQKLRIEIVKKCWTQLAGELVVAGSDCVRAGVSQILLQIDP